MSKVLGMFQVEWVKWMQVLVVRQIVLLTKMPVMEQLARNSIPKLTKEACLMIKSISTA